MDCGEVEIYTNNSKQREVVKIMATNNCEFTAHLWHIFPNGRFIHTEVPPGGSIIRDDVISPGGKVEYECTLVSQVRGGGCTFKCDVIRRI